MFRPAERTRSEQRLTEALLIAIVVLAIDATSDMAWWSGILVAVAFVVVVYGLALAWAFRPAKDPHS
ncbi:MAG TPA: hypothetical protein VH479_13555 [Acidimicrobiales bacterium]|jgi:hypothetical protein